METPLPILESLLHEFPGLAYRCLNDGYWTMEYVSSGVEALTGYFADAFTGDQRITYSDIIHVDDRAQVHWEINAALDAGTGFALIYRIVAADGSIKEVSEHGNAIRDQNGSIVALQGFVTDVTDAQQTRRTLNELAFHDRLTGLPNRYFFENRLQEFLDEDANTHKTGALLWIDLDRLKSLNNIRGHAIGDLVLQQVSDRIREVVGLDGIAARFGSDEFVVLLEDVERASVKVDAVAEELLKRLSESFYLDGYIHMGSACLGIAYFSPKLDAMGEILKRADIAMYEAKAAGRNTVRLFNVQMQKSLNLRAELEKDIQRALQQDEFHLAYQPQVLDTGKVIGVEALMRWDHPFRGSISPAEFIPIAETSGLIVRCGEWVLNKACMQLKLWESSPLTQTMIIAINVSAQEIHQPGFIAQVKNVLRCTGANPKQLKLELTESSFVTDPEMTIEKMRMLKAMGIRFSLDDFGTGFSSLSYLWRLPLDQLKIDRSFVADADKDMNAAAITRSIIALGQSLNLEVIAEGVETDSQHRFLAAHGCRIYQGYLFGKPGSAQTLEDYLLQTL